MTARTQGNPETADWRAYYDRRKLALPRMTGALRQGQFHLPSPRVFTSRGPRLRVGAGAEEVDPAAGDTV